MHAQAERSHSLRRADSSRSHRGKVGRASTRKEGTTIGMAAAGALGSGFSIHSGLDSLVSGGGGMGGPARGGRVRAGFVQIARPFMILGVVACVIVWSPAILSTLSQDGEKPAQARLAAKKEGAKQAPYYRPF